MMMMRIVMITIMTISTIPIMMMIITIFMITVMPMIISSSAICKFYSERIWTKGGAMELKAAHVMPGNECIMIMDVVRFPPEATAHMQSIKEYIKSNRFDIKHAAPDYCGLMNNY